MYVINRTDPTKQSGRTPYELWFGKTANINNLKIFGTKCFVHVPKEKRRKLYKKPEKGFVLGYVEDCKGYRVYIPSLKDVVLSRDVLFKKEKVVPNQIEIRSEGEQNDTCDSGILSDNVFEQKEETDNDIQCDCETKPVQSSNGDNSNVRQLKDRNIIKQSSMVVRFRILLKCYLKITARL